MAKCKSCDAEIIFAKSPAGKLAPVDAEPNDDGNIELIEMHDGYRYLVMNKEEREEPSLLGSGRRYTSHFQTCPYANNFRKRDKKESSNG